MVSVTKVPTNVISGALGVGKTTLIKRLLKLKPPSERWAVLVNEFGEIGIDGSLLQPNISNSNTQQDIFLKEVPGGCMCCTSGLPMQVALNQLLRLSRPHRLLIEPTGLGHPKEVLQALGSKSNRDVLHVHSTLTLIDAVNLRAKRWREHQTFREQLQVADHIVLSKTDYYEDQDINNLKDYLNELGLSNRLLHAKNSNTIGLEDISILNRANALAVNRYSLFSEIDDHQIEQNSDSVASAINRVTKVKNEGQGYFSCGYICQPDITFEYENIRQIIQTLQISRFKALLITDKGAYGFNLADGNLTVEKYSTASDSRIEFISDDVAMVQKTAKIIEAAFGLSVFLKQ